MKISIESVGSDLRNNNVSCRDLRSPGICFKTKIAKNRIEQHFSIINGKQTTTGKRKMQRIKNLEH